jgi:hypothetical protein
MLAPFKCFVSDLLHSFRLNLVLQYTHQNLKAELDMIRKISWNLNHTSSISKELFNTQIIIRNIIYLHEIWGSYGGEYECDSLLICGAM